MGFEDPGGHEDHGRLCCIHASHGGLAGLEYLSSLWRPVDRCIPDLGRIRLGLGCSDSDTGCWQKVFARYEAHYLP